MRRIFLSVAFVLCAMSAIFSQTIIADGNLLVDESAVRFFLREAAAEITLVVENSPREEKARIRVELVAPNDEIKAVTEREIVLRTGKNELNLPLEICAKQITDDFAFYRLRYRIAGENKSAAGTIAVSQIAPEVFELEAIAETAINENQRYLVRVRAVQPTSFNGVADVGIAGEVTINSDESANPLIIKAESRTDAEGYALLEFRLPSSIAKADDSTLKITGEKNNLRREAEQTVYVSNSPVAYTQTDKPLYQPGQTLRVRTLFFNHSNFAVANANLTFKIEDPEGSLIQRIAAKTSRFGVASAEWQLPENARLGDYSITVEDENSGYVNRKTFKVSRYELPNFVVNAKTDRDFYLPENKTAKFEIRADYLFGQPVTRAKVRVVRETEREWNYKEQKYETKESEAHEGFLDAEGKFAADFDLSAEQKDFEPDFDDYDWEHFKDIKYAAYVTDLTTNRTEQRRFDVRLSHETIHVRLIGEDRNISRRLAPQFYVSTFYADGSPASCEVKIYRKKDEDENDRPITGKLLFKTRTNSRGAGKLILPLKALGEDDDELDLVISARDAGGKSGTEVKELDFADKPALRLETDKTIYRQNDPVRVSVISSQPETTVFLNVMSGRQVIYTRQAKIKAGQTEFVIPFQPDFKNILTIAADIENRDEDGDAEIIFSHKAVVFPKNPLGLQVQAETVRDVFRPGEEAIINFTSKRNDNNQTEEIALGVVVLDKAIEERALADGDSSGFLNGFEEPLMRGRGFGGITGIEVFNLDLAKPIAPEYELAVEISLRNYYNPEIFESRSFRREYQRIYEPYFKKQFAAIENALQTRYRETGESPANDAELRQILSAAGINFDALRDAWGNPFKTGFYITYDGERRFYVKSGGADEKFDTGDDLTVVDLEFNFFSSVGMKINRAVTEYNRRTEDYIRDYKTLREEVLKQGVDLNERLDPYGKRYRYDFVVDKSDFAVRVVTGGSNKKFGTRPKDYDDATVWENKIDYFVVLRANLNKTFSKYVREKQIFPRDEAETEMILEEIGFNLAASKDKFGRPYYISKEDVSRFADKVDLQVGATAKTQITPVTQRVVSYFLRSAGADGIKGNADDFELTRFVGIISEQLKDQSQPQKVTRGVPVSNQFTGSIQGTIYDQNGGIISNAKIKFYNFLAPNSPREQAQTIETTTDDKGFYSLADLPSRCRYGCQMTIEADNFKRTVIQNVPVTAENVTNIDVTLELGEISFEVTVISDYSGGGSIDPTGSEVQTSITQRSIELLPVNGRRLSQIRAIPTGVSFSSLLRLSPSTRPEGAAGGFQANDASSNAETKQQIETPRLREYFPETLVWQPELITGADGRAELKFKFADSLTTWKIAVVGSTADGEIGVFEKEIKTFQPFFAEHEPPKILTMGDRIKLPVVLRNYLSQPQNVRATMSGANWFQLLNEPTQIVAVAPNSSENAIFDFQTIASVKDGKQRVTASGTDAGDAIEKPVTVHPNGREIAATQGAVFKDSIGFDVNFPAETLPKTQRAELKIYPNLMAHVVESIEGILQRPTGCGEQTVSSSYPSLLILKTAKNDGDSALKAKANRYLRLGYDRLLGYKAAGGGFNYWGRGEADLALSAYALRFLTDAKEFVAVDADLIKETRDFLVKQQTANGSWQNGYSKTPDVILTAYIARILARIERDEKSNAALKQSLVFLQTETAKIDEPFALAQFALAEFDAGSENIALQIADKLRVMARSDADGVFWNLETNTPFHGWGIAGRTETTALVLQVLARAEEVSRKNAKAQSEGKDQKPKTDDQISKGLQFLLKNKDRYGVWYSTQTTINVLDALISLLPRNAGENSAGNKAEIFVNGNKAREIVLSNDSSNPIIFDLTLLLQTANNRVEIRQTGSQAASANVVQNFYVAWNGENEFRAANAKDMRLTVNYDKTTAAIGEEIICRVAVERVGFKGYGMLLAEIGLPPGADVSRESLEKAVENSNYSLSSYDVLPDRIIVYLWANAGGNKFEFKFKPRYGIEAASAPSVAYDYYNPEAGTTLAPTRFAIR